MISAARNSQANGYEKNNLLTSLPLFTETLLAKGKLYKNGSGQTNLAILPYTIRDKSKKLLISEDNYLFTGIGNEIVLAEIEKAAKGIGIDRISDLGTKETISFSVSKAPRVSSDNVFRTADVTPDSIG